jgi:hypothetical protein
MKKSLALSILVFTMLAACQPSILKDTSTQAGSVLTDVIHQLDSCKSREQLEPMITSEQANGYSVYSFTCSNSADTNYFISITFFDSEAAAHIQFETAQDDSPVLCFHGYDQYEMLSWKSSPGSFNVEERLGWQAGKWIVSIHDNYDYRFFHYNDINFSEAVYTSGVKHGLFPPGTCPTPGTVSSLPALTPTSSTP